MILTFQIDKLQPAAYQISVQSEGVEVTAAAVYPTIADAIRGEANAVPLTFAQFAEVRYGGVSSGTMALEALKSQADQVADRIVTIVADMHRVATS